MLNGALCTDYQVIKLTLDNLKIVWPTLVGCFCTKLSNRYSTIRGVPTAEIRLSGLKTEAG